MILLETLVAMTKWFSIQRKNCEVDFNQMVKIEENRNLNAIFCVENSFFIINRKNGLVND